MSPQLVDLLAGLSVAEAVFLAVGVFAASLVPWFLFVDSLVLVQPLVRARGYVARWSVASREVCLDAAALLILLTTRPKGAMA